MGDKPPPKAKAKKDTKATSSKAVAARAQIEEALESGRLVWNTKLERNGMTIIVSHKHSDCPHSLFVGEAMNKICKRAKMQDPACKGVRKVHVNQEKDKVILQCEGINLYGLQVLGDTVDTSKIYTNNIRKILEKYGVEAARASVVKEVSNVFGHYGIEVDKRHLSLIADYMGQAGGLRAFNRYGMMSCSSPLQQMSYETTMQFMTKACQDGKVDNLASPSSAIVLGQLPPVGTGMVSLMVDLEPPAPMWKKSKNFSFGS